MENFCQISKTIQRYHDRYEWSRAQRPQFDE